MDPEALDTIGNIGGISSPFALAAFVIYMMKRNGNGKHVSAELCDERSDHIKDSLREINRKLDKLNGDE